MGGKCKCGRLGVIAFGVSLGVVTGLSMLAIAWAGWWWGYGTNLIDQWTMVFPGYEATLKGGMVGLAWGFLEGYVLGVIWAIVYNICMCCCRCACCATNQNCKTS